MDGGSGWDDDRCTHVRSDSRVSVAEVTSDMVASEVNEEKEEEEEEREKETETVTVTASVRNKLSLRLISPPTELNSHLLLTELNDSPRSSELNTGPFLEELNIITQLNELNKSPYSEELNISPQPNEQNKSPFSEELNISPQPNELNKSPYSEELTSYSLFSEEPMWNGRRTSALSSQRYQQYVYL